MFCKDFMNLECQEILMTHSGTCNPSTPEGVRIRNILLIQTGYLYITVAPSRIKISHNREI